MFLPQSTFNPGTEMPAAPKPATAPTLDLTQPGPLVREAEILARHSPGKSRLSVLRGLTADESPRARIRRITDFLLQFEPEETVEMLKAAGKLAVRQDPSGLRFLFSFLEVKRPGIEVLRMIEPLNSLERVALRIIRGTWTPDEAGQESDVFAILETLEEATSLGVLDLGLEVLPRKPSALRALFRHLRGWFGNMRERLERGETLPPAALTLAAHLAILEIALLEKRVSRLAGAIDPYDARAMGRLMPVMSRYDQDIEHMKTVISKLTTYEPFYERLPTLEHALSSAEMDKIGKRLLADPVTNGLGRILRAMRAAPLLDREFAFLVSLVHQIAALRVTSAGESHPPDLLSVMLQVVESARGETGLRLRLEPEIADVIWPTVQTWGVLRRSPDSLEVRYREDRVLDFLHPDGTPLLPERPEEREPRELGIKELVRMQLHNEAFVLGILNNPKATSLPGVVPMIASQSRSLRVLDRIMRDRSLYTGPANKEVPRLLLTNPAHLPVNSLRRFIHVRFVSRLDLERLARSSTDVRSEVRKEILSYLRSMRKAA